VAAWQAVPEESDGDTVKLQYALTRSVRLEPRSSLLSARDVLFSRCFQVVFVMLEFQSRGLRHFCSGIWTRFQHICEGRVEKGRQKFRDLYYVAMSCQPSCHSSQDSLNFEEIE